MNIQAKSHIHATTSGVTFFPTTPCETTAPPALLTAIGGRVKRERARHRLSRRLLSERSGVSERFLAQLEHGSGNISVMRLKAIADALDTTLAALVADDGSVCEPQQPPLPPTDWRAHPGAIADLYRHADAREQAMVVELLVGSCRR